MGYRKRRVPLDHPLAHLNASARRTTVAVYEHRAVLYDAIGLGTHRCHWCGKPVEWDSPDRKTKLQVDHLNNDSADNRTENLVPTCNGCNVHRPGAHPFERVADDEPHLVRRDGRRVRAVPRVCEQCGQQFLIPPSSLTRSGTGRFCSRDCHYASRSRQAP